MAVKTGRVAEVEVEEDAFDVELVKSVFEVQKRPFCTGKIRFSLPIVLLGFSQIIACLSDFFIGIEESSRK